MGGDGQAAQGVGDGAGQESRQQDGKQDSPREDQDQGEAFGPDDPANLAGVHGQQKDAVMSSRDRHGGGNEGRAFRRPTYLRHRISALQRRRRFRPGLQDIIGRRLEDRGTTGADDCIEAVVECARHAAIPWLVGRIAEFIGWRGPRPAVADLVAQWTVDPQPRARILAEPDQGVGPGPVGQSRKHVRNHYGFGSRLIDPGLGQAAAEAVEVEEASGEDENGEDVDGQNPLAKRKAFRPAQPKVAIVTPRQSGIRPRRGSRSHRNRRRPGETCGASA